MHNYGLANSFENEQRSVADLIAEIATSTSDVTLRSADALAQVRRGVITGEGPTVAGRAHFSRSIDADTALCARIFSYWRVEPAILSAARRLRRCSTSTPLLALAGWRALR